MPADHKVSVAWQIVATFIIVANFWAFYRIRKLRRYLLYVIIPSIAFSIVIFGYAYSDAFQKAFDQNYTSLCDEPILNRPWDSVNSVGRYNCETQYYAYIVGNVMNLAFQGFAIYLIIRWSRQHNRPYEAKVEPPK